MKLLNWQNAQPSALKSAAIKLEKWQDELLRPYLEKTWKALRQALFTASELQVWSQHDASGNITWHAFDPITGQAVHNLTEAEMRIWIEQQYYYPIASE